MSTLQKLLRIDFLLAFVSISGTLGKLFDPFIVGTALPILYVAIWFVHERISHTGKWGHAHGSKAPRHPVTQCD